MRFEEKVVTPEEALKWLDERAENRPVSDVVVKDYARQMKAGWWQDSPQGICFGIDGKLIDGQHRLWAVVESKMPVKLNIIWDAPDQSFHIIDRGYPRTVSFITKVPRHATSCYQLLLRLAGAGKPAPNDIVSMNTLLGTHADSLQRASSSKLPFYSSVPIRTAAMVALKKGEPARFVLNNWSLVSKAQEKGAPPVIKAFYEMQRRGSLFSKQSSQDSRRKELYLRARYLFEEVNANKDSFPKNFFGTSITSRYTQDVRDIVKNALGTHYNQKASMAQENIASRLHPVDVNSKLTQQLSRLIDAEQARLSMSAKD